ncbi:MAG: ABC transporter ATP-binding protein [Gaiellaceae bacterium]
MQARTSAVRTRALTKLYGSTPALVRADVDVPAGCVAVLLGPNGAGKSTLLRLLAGVLRPSAGRASVWGHDIVAEAVAVRGAVDLLPAVGGMYLELSAVENLRFCVRMRGLPHGDAELRGALDRVGLLSVAGDPLGTYSTGMVRRAGLARLLLTRPRLALLDEPYASLDEEGRALLEEILDETRRAGRSALVATHERDRSVVLADRVYELARGLVTERSEAGPFAAAVRT